MILRLWLDEEQIQALRSDTKPRLNSKGEVLRWGNSRVKFVPNPSRKEWRFLDAAPGAPVGFGVYVGRLRASYIMQRKIGGNAMRWKVCDASEMALAEAYELALRMVEKLTARAEAIEGGMPKTVRAARVVRQVREEYEVPPEVGLSRQKEMPIRQIYKRMEIAIPFLPKRDGAKKSSTPEQVCERGSVVTQLRSILVIAPTHC